MNQKQRDEFVRLLGEGDLAHSDIILAVDRLRARVELLEERIETSQWVAARELKKQGSRVAELQSGLHEISASLPVHESKDLDADNVDHVCRAVKSALRRYADQVERVDDRVTALQSQNSLQANTSDRENLLLKNRVVVRQRELVDALARVAELEKELAAGKLLVHASVAAERVSPRLVAWAGEPEQSGEVDDIAEEATAAIRRVERWAGTDQNGEDGSNVR